MLETKVQSLCKSDISLQVNSPEGEQISEPIEHGLELGANRAIDDHDHLFGLMH